MLPSFEWKRLRGLKTEFIEIRDNLELTLAPSPCCTASLYSLNFVQAHWSTRSEQLF
jgi:hypothetical protein